VSGYGLDDRAIEVRSPAGEKDFSSNLCVQTGSGAHPAFSPMGTGVMINVYNILVLKPDERVHAEDTDVDGRKGSWLGESGMD
jgi:hypothetical protein